MGKVRTRKVKVLARKLMERPRTEATANFDQNKRFVESSLSGSISKKMRNKIAGYLTAMEKRRARQRALETMGVAQEQSSDESTVNA
ncbi:MAG: 30S ribosomal protein S17e [Aigarchaeota archaeon]|nr:30S ribosomal protein S17e [Aigarchaeota archaeon]MDW8092193.1 30S ribosomal protein S17e [Nitrososphaerota archaeon]